MALEGAAAHLISARVTAAAECRLRAPGPVALSGRPLNKECRASGRSAGPPPPGDIMTPISQPILTRSLTAALAGLGLG
ncbi:hypothetical protein SR39_28635 [Methylobacterium radiotolerans]|nr:hypothetical protein SR39_28635 [Methylobacterium radiotolerans]